MFGLGFSEIVVLGVLALILLGPEQLPDLARKLGKFINELKRTTDGIKEEFKSTGLHPSTLLEEIKREGPEAAPKATAPVTQTPQNLVPTDILPPENPADLMKSGHVDNVHAAVETKPSGSDDSGKK